MLEPYFPTAHCWTSIAQTLVTWARQQTTASPHDLSGLWCVVPDLAHAPLLRQALHAQLGAAHIPPRLFTLRTLAEEWGSTDGRVELSEPVRLLTVYGVLREQAWAHKITGGAAGASTLWTLARQLLQLCDELSTYVSENADVPWQNEAGLQAWLQQHFGGRAALLSVEAQLLLRVWQALRDPCNPPTLLQQRLANVAQQAPHWGCRSWWWVTDQPWEQLPAWQRHWAHTCEQTLPMHVWHPTWDKAWPRAVTASTYEVVACHHLEQEALSAARAVLAHWQTWQQARGKKLAVIAQDVVVARRLQALLARAQVPVQDETGWKLSTTAAATALMRWLEVSLRNAPWNTVLEVIKSPFVQLGPDEVQTRLAHRADEIWRATQTRQGWATLYDRLTQSLANSDDSHALLSCFQVLADESRRVQGHGSLRTQLQRLLKGLQALGMAAQFEQDAAGAHILQLLQTTLWALPDNDAVTLSLAEFQAWLSQQLETQAFRPLAVADDRSPNSITFVSLTGARLRSWDAVVLVGAGADVLQAHINEALFFGETVRHELGLPTRAQRQAQLEQHVLEILSLQVPTTLTWRARQGDEPLPLAPLLARLELAALRRERDIFISQYTAQPHHCTAQPLAPQASVTVDSTLLPTRLSAHGWKTLVACPYQFWAQAVWRLDERDDLQDTATKRDYGQAVHDILYTAHTRFEATPKTDFAAILDATAQEAFQALAERYPDAFEWQHRFDTWKTFYLNWWDSHRAEGWRWVGGELSREYTLALPDGRQLRLQGRLDRLDQHDEQQRLWVLDYKAKSEDAIKKMQRDLGEEVQLLFYGVLSQPEAENAQCTLNAAYLPADKIKEVLQPQLATDDDTTFAEYVLQEKQRIQTVWSGLQDGVSLWAQGTAQACQHCIMRGLCRRDERETPEAASS